MNWTTMTILGDVGGWGHHMDGWGWGGAIVGWLLIALLAVLIGWLVWSVARRSSGPDPVESPREMLDRRYARGEIDREEYLQRKADLSD